MDLFELAAQPSAEAVRAVETLHKKLAVGEVMGGELIAKVSSMVIRDKLVPPKAMELLPFNGTGTDGIRIMYGGLAHSIHNHALNQLASTAGIPKMFVTRLVSGEPWERELLVKNFEEIYHKAAFKGRRDAAPMFLHRIVGSELRGFLSRSYNRYLASAPLLRAYVEACTAVGAIPIDAVASDIRISLKCYLPHVFEPVPNEFVGVGVNWTNSDFGSGRLKVSLSVMRISSGTMAVWEDKISRVHLGSVIQESDIEISDETAIKEVEAQSSAIHDAVRGQLSPEAVSQVLKVISIAHEEEIPWHKLKAMFGQLLTKKELELVETMLKAGNSDIIDLPPVGVKGDTPVATRWWAANVLGYVASSEKSADRKLDLQALAGEVMDAA